jgi:hypothetical protein
MNRMALDSFSQDAAGPKGDFQQQLEQLAEAGFQGIQFAQPGSSVDLAACRALNMGVAGSGRVNNACEAALLAEQIAGDGYECATLHAGWGMEDDNEAFALIEAILDASSSNAVPLYVETHRATIFQDMWRAVKFVERFPELRFNGDFSHWYTGQEMVYGGFDNKFAFIQPVLDRVRFIHGRIANPGCIQVAVDPDVEPQPPYVEHFKKLWTASFHGFVSNPESPFICFTPELLAPGIYYARTFEGREESDRWQQSLLLNEIARQCFERACSP